MKDINLVAEWWPLYAAGALLFLFLELLRALDWLPFWTIWIPIILLAMITIILWLWQILSDFLTAEEYSDGDVPFCGNHQVEKLS